jgi:phosphoglycolate phosphatase-like HAD superfamily hydrolase
VLARELSRGNIRKPALYLGDSRYDHEAAVAAGLDFVFVSSMTEFDGWQEYCAAHDIPVIDQLSALLQD